MLISKRNEAYRSGQLKYFTGKPCKNGHLTYRYTMTGACAGCKNGFSNLGEYTRLTLRVRNVHVTLVEEYVANLNKLSEIDK